MLLPCCTSAIEAASAGGLRATRRGDGPTSGDVQDASRGFMNVDCAAKIQPSVHGINKAPSLARNSLPESQITWERNRTRIRFCAEAEKEVPVVRVEGCCTGGCCPRWSARTVRNRNRTGPGVLEMMPQKQTPTDNKRGAHAISPAPSLSRRSTAAAIIATGTTAAAIFGDRDSSSNT